MMSKLPKFLLCENPIADKSDGRQFIFHTREPMLLAEAIHYAIVEEEAAAISKMQFNQSFVFDYELETIVMGLVIAPDNPGNLEGLLRRMADWYKAYLIWEDGNIDTSEQAQHN